MNLRVPIDQLAVGDWIVLHFASRVRHYRLEGAERVGPDWIRIWFDNGRQQLAAPADQLITITRPEDSR